MYKKIAIKYYEDKIKNKHDLDEIKTLKTIIRNIKNNKELFFDCFNKRDLDDKIIKLNFNN